MLAVVVAALCGWSMVFAASRPTDAGLSGGDWLIRVDSSTDARQLAESLGAEYIRPLRGVRGYHRIRFIETVESRPDVPNAVDRVRQLLESKPQVLRFEQEQLVQRFPRNFVPADPRFEDQWHLENVGQSGGLPNADARVRPVWDAGWRGDGVVIAIVDEGIQFNHPDLSTNWVSGTGYDYNDDDANPSPSGSDDRHGTAVAGVALAATNTTGGLGVAPGAGLVPLRLIAGPYQYGEEAEALSYQRDLVDIYNNSWGPSDDFGVMYDDSSLAFKDALFDNVREGRGGLGNIYVWAAGNGGLNGDNSNYDGYNASPYTISVGAVAHDDIKTSYSERGANLLVVAPSGGRGGGIVTADNTGSSGYSPTDVYDNFGGTSAAAPIVAGVVALMLEARPDLGWRDVQEILALSASPVDFTFAKWARNAARHWVSHDYGFGRVDASAAVQLALQWPKLEPMMVATGRYDATATLQPNIPVRRSVSIQEQMRVQHVMVTVDANHQDWGDLRMVIISPSGTRSTLSEPHSNANDSGDPGEWTYLSTHFLGEPSAGTWTLEITDEVAGSGGFLRSWSIEIFGTSFAQSGQAENTAPFAEDLVIESVAYPIEIDALAGIIDAEGDPIELVSVQLPRYGELLDLGTGRFSYTMGDTEDGSDLFSVLLSDGKGGVTRRLVQILDPRPVAQNDLYTIESGASVYLPVLDNDLDPDNDPLTLTELSASHEGQARIEPDGRIAYSAPPGFVGTERIQYFLDDGSDGISSAWVTIIVEEQTDMALRFDGEDDYARVAGGTPFNLRDKFTAEAWIYPEDWGEYVTGFGRIYDRSAFVFFLNGFDHSFYNDRSLVIYMTLENGVSLAVNTNSNVIELNRWQHVAFSMDSSRLSDPVRVYVDGREVGFGYPLGSARPNRPLSESSNFPLYMGESDSGARAFKGMMTEFRIWDRFLDSQEVLERHNTRLQGNEAGLQFYLPLNQSLTNEAISVVSGQNANGGPVVATVFEARRVPLELPWTEFEAHYDIVVDYENGWWEERTLGPVFGDRFPWIQVSGLNWVYTGHAPGSNQYNLFPASGGWGWLYSDPRLYPWLYRYTTADWYWYWPGTAFPGWFFQSSTGNWTFGPP
jgi:subtilisin family serine protease/subtilisin-like proprotein convertase family protein